MSEYDKNDRALVNYRENSNNFSEEEYREVDIAEEDKLDSSSEVYDLPEGRGARNLIWAVMSVVFGVGAIVSSPLYIMSLVLSVLSLGAVAYSRYRMGFFTRMALSGMILGVIGAVFGLFSAIVDISGIFNRL